MRHICIYQATRVFRCMRVLMDISTITRISNNTQDRALKEAGMCISNNTQDRALKEAGMCVYQTTLKIELLKRQAYVYIKQQDRARKEAGICVYQTTRQSS